MSEESSEAGRAHGAGNRFVLASSGEARGSGVEGVGRQFCRKGIHSCVPAVTLTFRGGEGRFHWCTEHAADAERYRPASDQADEADPCANGCSNPAAHAEGAHDV